MCIYILANITELSIITVLVYTHQVLFLHTCLYIVISTFLIFVFLIKLMSHCSFNLHLFWMRCEFLFKNPFKSTPPPFCVRKLATFFDFNSVGSLLFYIDDILKEKFSFFVFKVFYVCFKLMEFIGVLQLFDFKSHLEGDFCAFEIIKRVSLFFI